MIRFLNIKDKTFDLEEGDTINIKIIFLPNYYFAPRVTNEEFDNVLIEIMTYIFGNINFNFTFLIELDPLDD